MNLRERQWREKLAEMIRTLDVKMGTPEMDWAERARLDVLRERLAGSLGGEEGHTSTSQLRERGASDYNEAAKILGLDVPELVPPRSTKPKETLARAFDSFRPAKDKYGDRL